MFIILSLRPILEGNSATAAYGPLAASPRPVGVARPRHIEDWTVRGSA